MQINRAGLMGNFCGPKLFLSCHHLLWAISQHAKLDLIWLERWLNKYGLVVQVHKLVLKSGTLRTIIDN